ncbi:hypothetical protein BH11MYX2_BH11MYX2_06960 [soil metagenome]
MKPVYIAAAFICATGASALATPHPNPYSYPYETLAEGALEVETYVDIVPTKVTIEKPDGTLDATWSTHDSLQTEIEYGLTDRLELGMYFQFRQGATAGSPFLRFSGVKQRLRYRFAEAGELPIDIGIYGEVSEFYNELEFEEKLLLAKRVGSFNFVANLWVEQEWYWQEKDVKFIYNPTVAFNYEITPRFLVGAEYWARGRFDDPPASTTANSSDDAPKRANHYVGPTFLFQTSKISYSLGVYARLNNFTDTAAVNDQYGKIWFRGVIAVDI